MTKDELNDKRCFFVGNYSVLFAHNVSQQSVPYYLPKEHVSIIKNIFKKISTIVPVIYFHNGLVSISLKLNLIIMFFRTAFTILILSSGIFPIDKEISHHFSFSFHFYNPPFPEIILLFQFIKDFL